MWRASRKFQFEYFYNYFHFIHTFICRGDHVEVITIDYDPNEITYLQLLNLFWNNHEYGLTTRVKRQYASVIFYHSDDQKCIAVESLESERINRPDEQIITEITSAELIYTAEEWVFLWFHWTQRQNNENIFKSKFF